jgi:hypothetical protein
MNRRYSYSKLIALTAGLASLAGSLQAAVIVDFEETTDRNLFTINQAAPNNSGSNDTNFTWSSTVGVGGSGGLSVVGDSRVWGYNVTSYDLSTLSSLTITLDAKKASNTDIANRVGILADLGEAFGTNPYVDYFSGSLRIMNANTAPIQTITLANGNWSRIEMQVVRNTTSSVWDITAKLFDLGPNGTTTPNLLGTLNAADSTLYSDTSVYAAFKLKNVIGGAGASAADNFTIIPIPEPSAALLGGLGVLLLLRRRRPV